MTDTLHPFIWYELLTTNADAATSFYADVAGWTITDSGQSGMDYRQLSAPDGMVGGLMPLPPEALDHGARPVWLGYIHVPDVDAAAQAIVDDGGAVQMPAMDIPGVGRIAMMRDPWGAPFYIMTPATEGESTACAMRPGHVAWNELITDDLDGAKAFYTRHFNWVLHDAMDMGEMGAYQFFAIGAGDTCGAVVGAMMRRPPMVPVSMWLYYIVTDDIDAALARAQAGGGTLVFGPQEIPGGEYIFQAMDPQGALFAMVGPRKGADA